MKYLLVFLFSLNLLATEVDGTITYKLPSGELVDRNVSIEVPSRGMGEVVLRGERFEWKTDKFWSKNKNDRLVFTAEFETEFRGLKSTIVLKGTYLKGSNKLIYAGDVYKKKDELKHIGLFNFNYLR
ncbi:MAG: hypothetical protein ACO20H_11305 [Bacteriovoracaceae bacterium]